MRDSKRALGARAVLAFAVVGLAGVPAAQAATHGRKPVAASGPQVTSNAQDKGAAPNSAAQSLRVYLAPKGGEDALKAAVDAVSAPGSATYGRYLTPAQFHAQYDPAAASVQAVKQWLKSEGLKVTGAEAHNRYLTVTGTAAQAETAFATQLHEYTKDGQTFQAPAQTATVPDDVSASILAVSGLANPKRMMAPKAAPIPPPAGFVNARPCSKFYGQISADFQADFQTPLPKFNGKTLPYSPCGYTPPQFRSAYEANKASKFNGAGVTVGILDAYAAPTIEQDANQYATRQGDQPFAAGQFSQNVPPAFTHVDECGASGWFGEETLDVESVHGMAPASNVRYYGSTSCFNDDMEDTLLTVVDEDKVQILSNSYGDLEENETTADVKANEQAFLQGGLEGITFLFSSGDNGDELANSGRIQADYPASDPYITAVGGTSTGIAQDGTRTFDTGWGTNKYSLSADGKSWTPAGYLYGSGGGFSDLFNRPDYQNKTVPASAPPGRAVPDIAADADPTTGMLVGETQTFPDGVRYGEYRIGGTSLASPLMAGFLALTVQAAGSPQGFINPKLYQKAKNKPGELLTDVSGPGPDAGNVRADYANSVDASGGVLYSVRTFNQDSSLTVGPGWDDVTGNGVPTPKFISAFNAAG